MIRRRLRIRGVRPGERLEWRGQYLLLLLVSIPIGLLAFVFDVDGGWVWLGVIVAAAVAAGLSRSVRAWLFGEDPPR